MHEYEIYLPIVLPWILGGHGSVTSVFIPRNDKKLIASSINNTWQINNWGQFIHSPQYGPLLLPNLKLFHKGTTGNLSTELNSCRNIQRVILVNGIPNRRAWHMDFRRPNKYKNLITCRFKCPYTLTESNTTSARRKET